MVDEKPQHPYRDPVDLALMIASVPWGAPVQELDDIGMDIRLQLMDRGFEDAPRAEVIEAVVSVLHACDVVDSKMASLRGLVRPVVAIVAGLGVMATKLPLGSGADGVATALLALSVLPLLLLAPIARVEVVAKRVRYAAEALEKYITARVEPVEPPSGVRVDTGEAGGEGEPGASSAASPKERKAQP